jgi:aspartyl-tRNA(Asn)/glutamyl-tRNA(Gln) amidotransferase subunit C
MPAEREDFPVARVAALARLRLSPTEAALYQAQLAHILAFVDKVTAATFDDERRPESPAEPRQPPERPDAVGPSLPAEAALANAPDARDAPCLFRVPKVLG